MRGENNDVFNYKFIATWNAGTNKNTNVVGNKTINFLSVNPEKR